MAGTGHDVVVRGGTVVDGTGAAARTADVAIDERPHHRDRAGSTAGAPRRSTPTAPSSPRAGSTSTPTTTARSPGTPRSRPSSWHGVTTVVMGNCGVGFAPGAPRRRGLPHRAHGGRRGHPRHRPPRGHRLAVGELRRVPRRRRRHAPRARRRRPGAPRRRAGLRAWASGPTRTPRPTRSPRWPTVVEEAMRAGAVGFTTSRTILHSSKHGLVPGTEAPLDELYALADAVGAAGHGVLEVIDDAYTTGGGHEQLVELAERGRHRDLQPGPGRLRPRGLPPGARRTPPTTSPPGAASCPRCRTGPPGCSSGSQSSLHPFITHPTYRAMADLPLAERVARLREPEVREASSSPRSRRPQNRIAVGLMTRCDQIFPLGDPPDYEPHPSTSIAGVAAATGRTPQDVALDWLLERRRHGAALRPARQLRRRRPRGDPRDDDPPGDRARPLRRRRPLRPHLRRVDAHLPAHPLGPRPQPGRAPPGRAAGAHADRPHRRRSTASPTAAPSSPASGPTSTSSTTTASACTPPRWSSTCPPPAGGSCSGSTATSPRSWPASRPSRAASRPAPGPAASSAAARPEAPQAAGGPGWTLRCSSTT